MTALLAAVLVAVATYAAFPVCHRLGAPPARPQQAAPVAGVLRWRPVLCPLGFVAGWVFVGGPVGVVAGGAAAVAMWVVCGRAESPGERRRREQLAADLPVGVELLGASLRAGAAPESALRECGEALRGPLGEEFTRVHHQLALGLDPAQVWNQVGRHPRLGPLGRAIGRAHESGASVTDAVSRLAEDLRADAQVELEERARGIEVRSAAPLGICLLPAFVLLGIVPLIAGLFASMALFR